MEHHGWWVVHRVRKEGQEGRIVLQFTPTMAIVTRTRSAFRKEEGGGYARKGGIYLLQGKFG